MTRTGEKHIGLISIFVSLVSWLIPPSIAAGALWACMEVFNEPIDQPYQVLMVVTLILAALLFSNHGADEPASQRNAWATAAWVSLTWLLLFSILLLIGYATKTSELYSRRVLLTWFVVTPPLIVLAKLAVYRLLLPLLWASSNGRKVVIAGANDVGKALAQEINTDPTMGMELVGFFDDRGEPRVGELADSQVLGSLGELPDFARRENVDVIFIALPIRHVERVSMVIDELFDTTASIYFLPDIFAFDLIQSRTTEIGGLPAIALCETPFYGPSGMVKRISDVFMGSALLLVLSPLLLLIAVAIKLTSPGSVLFRQRRYGLDGKEIIVYKFRSMRVSEDGDKVVQATENDPRVTPLGRILRKYSLDELPQIINVVQGRMSLVGPRPHAVAHNEEYRAVIKGYMLRHKVRPGITGLAQVNGCRGETKTIEDMRRRVQYDLDYLRHWSLGLDLSIIFRTILVVLKGDKAY
jgi:putative colanic acid biosysnthesis UDP-glucose lipid carrier transferase